MQYQKLECQNFCVSICKITDLGDFTENLHRNSDTPSKTNMRQFISFFDSPFLDYIP